MLVHDLPLGDLGLEFSIRDPLHGFVHFNELEKEIINHHRFQRLRFIHQLAFTNFVYPAAGHTRFEHSIGVMEVATRIFLRIVTKCKRDIIRLYESSLKEEQFKHEAIRALQVLRLACLLHDTGHGPFSHAAEALYPVVRKKQYKHEDYSVKVIMGFEELLKNSAANKKLAKVTKTSPITASDVASLLDGEIEVGHLHIQFWSLIKSIVSGQLDADRMDYLLRDSYHAGVMYGHFDLNRVIESMTLCLAPSTKPEDPISNDLIIALEYDDWLTGESVVMARRAMFNQVYLHKTRRAFDMMLALAIRRLRNGKSYPTPDRLEEYLSLDDVSLLEQIRNYKGDGMLLRSAIRDRQFHRSIGVLNDDELDQQVSSLRIQLHTSGLRTYTDSELLSHAELNDLESDDAIWVDTGATFTTYKSDRGSEIRLRDGRSRKASSSREQLRSVPLSHASRDLKLQDPLRKLSYRVYSVDKLRSVVEKAIVKVGGVV